MSKAGDKSEAAGPGRKLEAGRIEDLIKEVTALFASMQTFRRELAAIRHPKQREDRFETISDQLDAIVSTTEEATNTIMDTVEKISDMIGDRRADLDGAGLRDWADQINTHFLAVFEACSFQDITGQRISKVVEELKFVNDKLASMVDIWGPEAISREPLGDGDAELPAGGRLHGPALHGEGASQDEIDKLFD